MSRRVWTGTVASAIASVGLASGQTTPSTATDGASTGVVTLRTAGQPDRRLQVLKCERLSDGKILTEVKDLATGQVFTIADTKPFSGIEPTGAKSALPVMTPATHVQSQVQSQVQTMLPGTTIPAAASTLPTARTRTNDPLLGGASVPATAATQSRVATRYENVPMTPPAAENPTLLGKLRGNSSTTATALPATVGTPKQQSALSAALFGTYPTQPQEQPTMLGKMSETRTATATTYQNRTAYPTTMTQPAASSGGLKSAIFGSPEQVAVQQSNPTLMGKLFGDKPAAQPMPTMVAQAPRSNGTYGNANVIRPASVSTANARMMTPTATVMAAAPVMEPRAVAVMPVTPAAPVMAPAMASPVQAASYAPVSTDTRDPNFHVVPAAPMTMKQIEDQVKELRMNQRPSKRMEAATALAAGPMANMVEVRQILAEATYRDPVGVVRGHCIELLSRMKYDEHNYKQYVESLVNDDEPAVQRAARLAVK